MITWGAARLDRDAKAIELAKEKLGPLAMTTPEGRKLAQDIKQQLTESDDELARRTR